MHETTIDRLLVHVNDYGIVVCKTCRFAVQPSALPSHLLRHRIYRNERRQILQKLSKLQLRDPGHVPHPSNNPQPLPHLAVHSGYRCNAPDCDHACVSSKRMSQHWSDQHDEHDSKNVDARPAYLQTFFRGNKIRYFEVNGPGNEAGPNDDTPVNPSLSPSSGAEQLRTPTRDTFSKISLSSLPTIPTLDLPALRYFHHYIVTTSPTFRRSIQESTTFYQVDIVHQAFQHPFLMFAILSVSALHIATIADDQQHLSIALKYENAALTDFCSAMRTPNAENSTALIAFGRFFGVQRCVQHQLEWSLNTPSPETDSDMGKLLEFFFLLRGGYGMLISLQHLLPAGSEFTIPPETVDGMRELDDWGDLSAEQLSHVPAEIVQRLMALPGKLTPLLLELESDEKDVWVDIEPAVSRLLSAFALSYASTEVRGLWDAAEGWLRTIPDHFIHMLSSAAPGALVIFAYWILLVQRLDCHYWFVKGQAVRLHSITSANLPNEKWRSLVADII